MVRRLDPIESPAGPVTRPSFRQISPCAAQITLPGTVVPSTVHGREHRRKIFILPPVSLCAKPYYVNQAKWSRHALSSRMLFVHIDARDQRRGHTRFVSTLDGPVTRRGQRRAVRRFHGLRGARGAPIRHESVSFRTTLIDSFVSLMARSDFGPCEPGFAARCLYSLLTLIVRVTTRITSFGRHIRDKVPCWRRRDVPPGDPSRFFIPGVSKPKPAGICDTFLSS